MDIYTVRDVAEDFGVSEATVRNWIKKGDLKATKTSNRGGYLIAEEDLDAYCELVDRRYEKEQSPEELDEADEDEITDEDILDMLLKWNDKEITELEHKLAELEKERNETLARLRVVYVARERLESW